MNRPVPRPAPPDVAQTLRDKMRRGLLTPGQRLVEADLMRETGASRSKVREALRQLAAEGLVSIEEFRGASVRRLTRDQALQITRAREALEAMAARLVAERDLPKREREHLRKLQDDMDDAARARQAERYTRLNDAFHEFLMTEAKNDYIAAFVERLRLPLFRVQFAMGWGTETMLRRNVDHQRITQAILKNDPDAAEAAMREHLRNGATNMDRIEDTYFEK
jgi:DNA-binding GntR family transcriptional regulator